MNRITKNMREHGASSVTDWEDWASSAEALLNEGADEIEKLRHALDLALSRGCEHCAEPIRKARAIAGRRS